MILEASEMELQNNYSWICKISEKLNNILNSEG